MIQKIENKRAEIAKSLQSGKLVPVKMATRLSPALYLEFTNKMREIGIDCEATALKIVIKHWLGR
jgi:hypothetical protein